MILDEKTIDESTLSSLYLILELEITIRHALVHHKTELDRLRNIRTEVENLCLRLDDRLEPDWVAHIILESIQTNESPFERLTLPLPILDDSDIENITSGINNIQARFYREIRCISTEMSEYAFLISDLSCQNNLEELFYWWRFVSDESNRMKFNLRGGVGDIGFATVDGITTFPMPRSTPRFRLVRERNYEIYSNESEVTKSGISQGVKKLFLSIDIEKNCQNFDEIIEEFKLELAKCQSAHHYNQLIGGDVNTSFTPIEIPNVLKIKARRINKIIPYKFRKDYINKTLAGIMCWDLCKCEGKTKKEALEAIASMYDEAIKGAEIQARIIRNIDQSYNEVRERIESKTLKASR